MVLRKAASAALCLLVLSRSSLAHEHHTDNIPEGSFFSPDPIDSILWAHILIQILAWGIVFPTGMVLGMIRSRWHIPTQVLGTVLAIAAYFLGHKHKGRQFAPNVHAQFANTLGFMLALQILLGIYLKLHLEKGFLGVIRPWLVRLHGVVGKALPVVAWVQMLFGGITAMGYCRDDHLGQCLAHYIMGSAFIGYGILLTIILLAGQYWLKRTGRSQEFFDSAIIAAWGCVNTFTEHRWGQDWRGNDLQHTSMGIVWWCAGLLGIWLSRSRDGRPKRNLVPALVIIITGWAMGAHPQDIPLSTMVHTVFGYTLMAAGVARLVEVSFVLRDRANLSGSGSSKEEINSFQYLTPFLLYASGLLFMGATEEQIAILSSQGVTHVSYILLIFSAAFLLFLFVNVLVHVYAQSTQPLDLDGLSKRSDDSDELHSEEYRHREGGIKLPATPLAARRKRDLDRARQAEEFELQGLIEEGADVEEGDVAEGSSRDGGSSSEDSGSGRRKENGRV